MFLSNKMNNSVLELSGCKEKQRGAVQSPFCKVGKYKSGLLTHLQAIPYTGRLCLLKMGDSCKQLKLSNCHIGRRPELFFFVFFSCLVFFSTPFLRIVLAPFFFFFFSPKYFFFQCLSHIFPSPLPFLSLIHVLLSQKTIGRGEGGNLSLSFFFSLFLFLSDETYPYNLVPVFLFPPALCLCSVSVLPTQHIKEWKEMEILRGRSHPQEFFIEPSRKKVIFFLAVCCSSLIDPKHTYT